MEVVHRADLVDRGVAQVVARAMDDSALDPAAGHPHAHRLVVMVAAAASLRHRCAAKFTRPDDERGIKHAAILQIRDQCHAGPVDLLGLELDAVLHAAVMVPVLVIKLDEPHAPFGKSPGQQAVGGKGAVAWLAAVELERLRALVLHVHQFRHARLHLEGHLILRDPRRDLGVAGERVVLGIEQVDRVNVGALTVPRDAVGIREVEHGIALRPQLHALVSARQEPARPLPRCDRLVLAPLAERREHDEPRQVGGLAAEAVGHP